MSPFAHLLYPRPARGGDTTTTSASTTPYLTRSPGTMDTTTTPSTPGSTIRNPTTVITPPSTATTAITGSTDMNQRVTPKRPSGCPAEMDQYVKISVHTAKCSVCDKRNGTDQMLRCPTCSWEICQPCQQEREQKGGMLIIGHGKVGITETPESRARLFTPTKPGVGVHRKAPGPNNNQTPAPKTATPKTTTATRNKDSNSNNNMQDDGKGEKRVAAVDEPAPASSPPDTDNNSRPVRKRRACVQTSTSDVEYDDDNNVAHVADKSSPTMPNKRSKTNAGASRGKRPATEAETASSPLLTQRQNTAAEKEFMAQNRKEVKEYWGPAFDGYTNEGHLLSRRLPPPETRIPDRVKQMAGEVKKRPSAEEIQRRIQTKLREKLGIPEEDNDDARTIREFVDKISGEHLGVGKLTPDDTDTLIYSVRKFLEETIKIQYAKGCLDLPLATLDLEQKKELAGVIADVLDDLKGNSAG